MDSVPDLRITYIKITHRDMMASFMLQFEPIKISQ